MKQTLCSFCGGAMPQEENPMESSRRNFPGEPDEVFFNRCHAAEEEEQPEAICPKCRKNLSNDQEERS